MKIKFGDIKQNQSDLNNMNNYREMALSLVDMHYRLITSEADDNKAWKQAVEHAKITCNAVLDNTNHLFVKDNFLTYEKIMGELWNI
jgi:hypothetical protein